MKINWNNVTWYSKGLALVLFIALPFIGFYFGTQYGSLQGYVKGVHAVLPQGSASSSVAGTDYYENVAVWAIDHGNGFSIAYPLDFDVEDNYAEIQSTDWRLDANGVSGIKMLTITIPRAFEPQTNFADATLTVGRSENKNAVAQCLNAGQNGGVVSTSTESMNGIPFFVSNSASVGAGNYYETTSYRTLHAGQCYAIEYTIHSSQIMNYPESYDLHAFDKAEIQSVLQRIVGTFKFE